MKEMWLIDEGTVVPVPYTPSKSNTKPQNDIIRVSYQLKNAKLYSKRVTQQKE